MANENQKKHKINFKKRIDQLNLPKKEKLKAVAIKYDIEKDKAPKIVASGKASIAEMILHIAEDHKIPLYEDPVLSNLLSKLELNQHIPSKLYAIIAEVLAFAYQLEKLSDKRNKINKKLKRK
ncbi:MAG: EscU/YscU/HrcU family type III secretion system export apparatus switch protein [bacterium]